MYKQRERRRKYCVCRSRVLGIRSVYSVVINNILMTSIFAQHTQHAYDFENLKNIQYTLDEKSIFDMLLENTFKKYY